MKKIAVMGLMAAHFAAFAAKADAAGGVYHKRDGAPTLEEIKEVQDNILTTFETFKEKNDERIAEIEKKGDADPVLKEQVEKITETLTSLKDMRDELDKLKVKMARPSGPEAEKEFSPEQVEHKTAFIDFLRNPTSEKSRVALEAAHQKAVDTVTDAAGGHAVPEIIARRVERELSEVSPLRQIVDVQRAGSKDFKILVDIRGLTYGWVGETDARPETGTPTLEEVAPTFGMIYAYPKASEESLDDMFFNVENWLVDAIVEGFAEGEENAIVNGDGTKKPTGFLDGTPTLQDDGTRAFGVLQYVASGAAAGFAGTNPADPFIDLVYKLKKGYRRNARWLMNKTTAGTVMKFKDGDGNYLWQPAVIDGQPDRFMNYPVAESEEMPDVAANAFPVAFGDFSAGYVLADLVGFRLTMDNNITEPGYVKWYARRRLGGEKKKSEAIKLMRNEA